MVMWMVNREKYVRKRLPPAIRHYHPGMDTSTWVETTAVVASTVGLHARPAAAFVNAAKAFDCDISVGRPGQDRVNAKSMLKLLTLAVVHGEEIVVAARGERADEAVETLADMLARSEE
jgi:phosphocarrier protein HPr